MRRALLITFVLAATAVAPASRSGTGLPNAAIDLVLVTDQLTAPIAMATRAGDTKLYFAEKGGRVKSVDGATITTLLNISGSVSNGGEQGLLGLAISPAGDEIFINFTNNAGDTVIRGYPFTGAVIDPESGYQILTIDQPFANHNGGNLAFGPDGFLYIGMGDGGSQDDPNNNAQRKGSLLGKMLRIDPTPGGGYVEPASNPYVGRKGKDEIWARGLRNPWRYSFDDFGASATDDLWIGDVGGARREEIDRQAGSSDGGENYGWRRMEGSKPHIGTEPRGHDGPVLQKLHSNGYCAIIGGYVYRGTDIPNLDGAYLYSDNCVTQIRAFLPSDPKGTDRGFDESPGGIASFGRDNDGELYALSLGGSVYRIDAETP
jgi:glucose/arabinose dehydrogenase